MERRKANKQITVEKLDHKLDEAISERLKLAEAVEEIHDKVNYDGGLVYQCDMKEYDAKNTSQHEEISAEVKKISDKLDLIFPVVDKQIQKSEAIDFLIQEYGGQVKTAKFWIQLTMLVIAVIIGVGYAITYLKSLFKGLI